MRSARRQHQCRGIHLPDFWRFEWELCRTRGEGAAQFPPNKTNNSLGASSAAGGTSPPCFCKTNPRPGGGRCCESNFNFQDAALSRELATKSMNATPNKDMQI